MTEIRASLLPRVVLCERHGETIPCATCALNRARGYRIQQKAGRGGKGGAGDGGKPWHAVLLARFKAVCGATPAGNSLGWSENEGKQVTCAVCITRLQGKKNQ